MAVLINPLAIPGAFEVVTSPHRDTRGEFVEWFKAPAFADATGMEFTLAQANLSTSSQGTVRGIHYADVPPGQAKYVTCPVGRILDFVVDIRVGSPSFGQWVSVELSGENRNAVFVSEGLGHMFLSLEDNTVVTYLVSDIFKPDREHAINPLDPVLGIDFPMPAPNLKISDKDLAAPGLIEARDQGLLPLWEDRQGS